MTEAEKNLKDIEDTYKTDNLGSAPLEIPKIHVRVEGKEIGAFEREEVFRRIRSGEIRPEARVWKNGMPGWVEAGNLPELEDYFDAMKGFYEEEEKSRKEEEAARYKAEQEAASRRAQQEAAAKAAEAEAAARAAQKAAEDKRRLDAEVKAGVDRQMAYYIRAAKIQTIRRRIGKTLVILGILGGIFFFVGKSFHPNIPNILNLFGKSAVDNTANNNDNATVNNNVNFRKGPSIDNEIIRQLKQGDTVTLTGETSGGWTQVTHNGDTGWVSSEYINIVVKRSP